MTSTENFDPGRISTGNELVFGVRMTLPPNDPMIAVLGENWETVRWYATAAERDAALTEMRSEHLFSRQGDRPTLVYEKVERDKPTQPILLPKAS